MEYLTVKEVAVILRVTEPTVRNRLRQGRIKGIWDGAKYLIPKTAIETIGVSAQVTASCQGRG